MNACRLGTMLCAGALLTSCAAITSSGNLPGPDSVERAEAAYSLPRTIFSVTASSNASGPTLVVTKSTEPDPGARFLLHYQGSPFSDDTIVAELSPDGLLKNVTSTTQDRSGDIAVNLAETVFTVGTNGAVLPQNLRALPATLPGRAGFAASYDPLDPVEVAATREPLGNAGFCISVGAETLLGAAACPNPPYRVKGFPTGGSTDPVQYLSRRSGVYYRQPTPVPVHIYRRASSGGWEPLFVGNETLFDKTELYEVAINRSAFVQKKVELNFDSGSLVKISVTKPSQLHALSTFGLKIVKTIVAIPIEALRQDKSLLEARAGHIQAQTQLLQRQDELVKLQVERQGSTSANLVRSNVSFVEAGTRSLGATAVDDLSICQTNLGASVAQCRNFVEQ